MLLTDAETKQIARKVLADALENVAKCSGGSYLGLKVIRTDAEDVTLRFACDFGYGLLKCQYEPLPGVERIVTQCEQKLDEYYSVDSADARIYHITMMAEAATVTSLMDLRLKIGDVPKDNAERGVLIASVLMRDSIAGFYEQKTLTPEIVDVRQEYDDAAAEAGAAYRAELVAMTKQLSNTIVAGKPGRRERLTKSLLLACINKRRAEGNEETVALLARDLNRDDERGRNTVRKALKKHGIELKNRNN
jgi:hypothetical protein